MTDKIYRLHNFEPDKETLVVAIPRKHIAELWDALYAAAYEGDELDTTDAIKEFLTICTDYGF